MQWERPLNKVLKRSVYLEQYAALQKQERNRKRMTFDEIINARKSIRRYSNRPIPESDVEAILRAGLLAPSARNRQNLKFIVVRDPMLRDELVGACNGQSMVGEAPAFLAVCSTAGSIMPNGQPTAPIDAAIAMTYMLLKAAELGIGSCWIGNFSQQKMKSLLCVPDMAEVIAVSPLGYPAVEGNERVRKPFDDVVCFGRYRD